ncbi:MAG: alginate export family protein [Pseudomonadota bacterium]
MRYTISTLAVLACLTSAAPAFAQDEAEKKPRPFDPVAIGDGVTLDPLLNMRLRVETADQSSFPEEASSITVRTRAGADIKWNNFSFLVEGEGTFQIDDDYNDTIPGNGVEPFPVIADPESIELNRIRIQYKTKDFKGTLGRQRIILDDARFIGNVGWRQNEQTFDAARASVTLGPVTVDQTYAVQQNTIFGSESPNGTFEGDFLFTNVSLPIDPVKIVAFRYEYDYDTRVAFSSETYGATATAKIPAGPVKIGLKGSYATQSDTGGNTVDYTADYYLAEASLTVAGFTLRGQHEVLGSDGGIQAFQTPLATAHKFNGYADLFLVTPATGLADTNVRISKKFKFDGLPSGVNVQLTYHDFQSDFGDIDYGTEIDAVVSFKVGEVALLAKYGDYTSDGFGPDTTRFTVQAGISF